MIQSSMPCTRRRPRPDGQFLSERQAVTVFRLGAWSSIVVADELGVDIRDFGIKDVDELLTAQELNEFVAFVRTLLARRQAGAA